MIRTTTALAGVFLVAAFGVSRAQTLLAPSQDCAAQVRGRPVFLNPYVQIVTLYRQKNIDGALRRLQEIGKERVTEVVERLEQLNKSARRDAGATSLPSDTCLEAAALVHTDLAMMVTRDTGWARASFHARAARSIIELMQGAEAFRRDWLLAMAYFHQKAIFSIDWSGRSGKTASESVDDIGRALAERAQSYFDEAVELYPEDAEILLAAGTLYEWGGFPRFGDEKRLRKAERLYRRAVEADPDMAEANLRYGRVLQKRGKHRDSAEPLQRTLELDESDVLNYFAHLLLGRLQERRDRAAEAVEHYRSATQILPDWQVAHIALSHALHVSGRRQASLEALARSVDVPAGSEDAMLGWWRYEMGRIRELDLLLERLRDGVFF